MSLELELRAAHRAEYEARRKLFRQWVNDWKSIGKERRLCLQLGAMCERVVEAEAMLDRYRSYEVSAECLPWHRLAQDYREAQWPS